MKYLLMIYGNHASWNALTKEAVARFERAHQSVQEELTASGELIDTQELAVEDSKVVRTSGGRSVVTAGPFTEGTQFISGYYLIDCPDMERATEIAGRFAEAEFAPIEVLRLGPNTAWDGPQGA
jgi:hypothetical protein